MLHLLISHSILSDNSFEFVDLFRICFPFFANNLNFNVSIMGAQISALEEDARVPDFSRIGWIKVSPERGSLDLLVTCLATLLLGVYSSPHPNLPMQLESNIKQHWRQFNWGWLGIPGPELIV